LGTRAKRLIFHVIEWIGALRIEGLDLYLDSRQPQSHCFVSHAHRDHLGVHTHTLATPQTAALARYRIETGAITELQCGILHTFDPHTQLRLAPAGHVLGSAMLHVTRPEGTLLYTGDFKLRSSLTVPQACPPQADVLLMESTYGQPIFRFPPWERVAEQLVDLVSSAIREGRQPIVMGYSLGKAQEITRILTRAGLAVTLHGAAYSMSRIYQQCGVELGTYRRYAPEDFHGPAALDPVERGVLVAPPHVARTAFVTRFKNPCRIIISGWAVLQNAIYRYGVDHALPLSDHADFDELLELVERVRPKKIYTHHGYREFADILRARGHDAQLARPEEQMRLFE
ncbi:MAG TPA: MBL fold metallo-hydrolase RNA specificity domain-containing protein, partial [Tepidisphaeraceae bacterium]|nr:MBL fold metallo-hydrolase RNA specificity domain-containing protein [Tepidisphaeraceae bacterium]